MGLRTERLAEQMRDYLAENFVDGRLADPSLDGVTITHVKLSADLQMASVYFRLYESDRLRKAMAGLERSKGRLRNSLARKLAIRRVPDLRFFYDESIEAGSRVEDLLRQAFA